MADPRAVMTPKSFISFFFASVVSLLMAWAALAEERRPIRVVGQPTQPFAFIDSEGNATGFNIDVIREIGQRLGRRVEIHLVPNMQEAKYLIKAGEADVVSETVPNAERSHDLAFTRPFTKTNVVLYALSSRANEFANIDYSRLRVAARKGGPEEAAAEAAGTIVVPFDSFEDAMIAVNSRQVDLVAAQQANWERMLKVLDISDNYTLVGVLLVQGNITFGVDRRQPDLLADIDGALRDLMVEPKFAELREKWFVAKQYWTVERVFVAAAAVICIILVGGLAAFLRWRAKLRNLEIRETRRREELAVSYTQEVERRNLLLKDSHDEMERILFAVTHDLKSPIVTVRGYAGVMEEAADEGDLAAMQSAAKRIIGGTEKLGLVTDALLAFGSFGRSEIDLSDVGLHPIVEDVKTMLANHINEAGARIEMREPFHALYADQSQVLRLLLNLVGNALRYGCPQPGMTVEVSTEACKGGTILTVRDHGPGVPENLRKDVFRLFRRYGPLKSGSTGLGLAIVEKIMSKHGGKCWIEDGQGGGAAFRAFFPDQSAASSPLAHQRISA